MNFLGQTSSYLSSRSMKTGQPHGGACDAFAFEDLDGGFLSTRLSSYFGEDDHQKHSIEPHALGEQVTVDNFDVDMLPDLFRAVGSLENAPNIPNVLHTPFSGRRDEARNVNPNLLLLPSSTSAPACPQHHCAPVSDPSVSLRLCTPHGTMQSLQECNTSAAKTTKNEEWGAMTSKPKLAIMARAPQQVLPKKVTSYQLSRRVSFDSNAAVVEKKNDAPKKSATWQELSSQINKFAQENAKNAGWDVFPRKKKAPSDSTLYKISIEEPEAFKNAKNAYRRSLETQEKLQEWDKKMGLKRCHSRTMTKSSISRRQLLQIMRDVNMRQKREAHAKSATSLAHKMGLKK